MSIYFILVFTISSDYKICLYKAKLMICEYCNMYTTHPLNKVNGLLPEIKEKFMLKNVEHVCESCFSKFKTSEQWHVKSQIIYSSQRRILHHKAV